MDGIPLDAGWSRLSRPLTGKPIEERRAMATPEPESETPQPPKSARRKFIRGPLELLRWARAGVSVWVMMSGDGTADQMTKTIIRPAVRAIAMVLGLDS